MQPGVLPPTVAPAAPEDEVDVEEVAAQLGLPAAMLIRRIEAGAIPARRLEGPDGVRYRVGAGALGVRLRGAEAVAQGEPSGTPRGALGTELAAIDLAPQDLAGLALDRWERALEERAAAERGRQRESLLREHAGEMARLQLEVARLGSELEHTQTRLRERDAELVRLRQPAPPAAAAHGDLEERLAGAERTVAARERELAVARGEAEKQRALALERERALADRDRALGARDRALAEHRGRAAVRERELTILRARVDEQASELEALRATRRRGLLRRG